MASIAGGGLSLGTLWVNIGAKVDEAQAALKKFGEDTTAAIEDQKSKWEGLKSVGDSMTKLGAGLTAGLTVPIVGIGGAAVKAASDFQQSLNKITAVGGQTGEDLEKLRAQAMQLGADTKYSAQEAAAGMGNLAAAGQSTQQIMASMPGVLDLAAAGELSVARAAEVTSDTLSQFGLDAGQAGHVADVFAQGAAASSISVAQMAESMKYAGPIAKSAGISIEEVATATALLGNAGIKGEQAGTSLRGILSSLVDPSTKAQEALNKLGVTVTDSAGKMLPLDQIFQKLQQSGASTADLFTIFGQNAASAAAALTEKAGPAWASMTEEIGKSDGAAKKMAETLNSGLAGGFEQLKGSVDTALISLGTALLPILTKLVSAATDFVNNFILPAVEWFGKLPAPVQDVAIALAAIGAAIGPVLVVMGTMVSSFATLWPLITAAAGVIGPFIVSIGAIPIAIAAVTAALVALGVWVYNNWDTIVAALSKAWDTIKETWNAVWTGIVAAVTAIWDGFKAAIAPYWKFITDLIGGIWNVVTAIWEAEWNLIVGAVKAIWNAIEPYVHTVFDPLIRLLEGLWDGIKSGWNAVWGAIKKAVTGTWDDFEKAANTIFKPIAKFLVDIWDDAKKIWVNTWEGIKDKVLGIWNDIKAAVTKFTDVLGSIGKVITGIPGKLNSVADSIRKVGTEADKAAGHSPVPEMNDAMGVMAERADALPNPLDAAAGKISALGTAAGTASGAFSLSLSPALGAAAIKIDDVGTSANDALAPLNSLNSAISTVSGAFSLSLSPALGAASTDVSGFGSTVTGLETTLPDSMGRTMSGISGKIGDPNFGAPSMKKPFEDLARDVTGIIGNFAQDITHSLWEGDLSWGEKGKKLLTSLGEAVTNAFVQPAAKAIGDLIGGAIADLLGKTGLGGIMDSLLNIGKTSEEVFTGVAGGAGQAAGGAAGSAGSAGGAAGAAAGTGLAGIVTAVAGVATAISSVISNFQLAGVNKSLDVIVNHTLRIFNELFNLRRDEWDRWGGWMLIKDDILNRLNILMDNSNLAILKFDDMIAALNSIMDNAAHCSLMLDSILAANDATAARQDSVMNRMLTAMERIAVSSERAMNVNLYGTDPSLVSAKLGTQLRLQGAFA